MSLLKIFSVGSMNTVVLLMLVFTKSSLLNLNYLCNQFIKEQFRIRITGYAGFGIFFKKLVSPITCLLLRVFVKLIKIYRFFKCERILAFVARFSSLIFDAFPLGIRGIINEYGILASKIQTNKYLVSDVPPNQSLDEKNGNSTQLPNTKFGGGNGSRVKQSPDDEYELIINAERVRYESANFFASDIKDKLSYEDPKFKLFPPFQRRLVWSIEQQSVLIESLLLSLPLPSVFLFETTEGKFEVIDGLQRLNSIRSFLDNEFALTDLKTIFSLNDSKFEDLGKDFQRKLLDYRVNATIVKLGFKNGNDPVGSVGETNIRRILFSRLNRGGTLLNAHQLRNALYPGEFNQLLISLSANKYFREAFNIPQNVSKLTRADPNLDKDNRKIYFYMNDCELVLRYFALKSGQFEGNTMEEVLDNTMRKLSLSCKTTPEIVEQLRKDYFSRLVFLCDLFGDHPFDDVIIQIDGLMENPSVRKVSVGLYESFMMAIDQEWDRKDKILERKSDVIQQKDYHLRISQNLRQFIEPIDGPFLKDRLDSRVKAALEVLLSNTKN